MNEVVYRFGHVFYVQVFENVYNWWYNE